VVAEIITVETYMRQILDFREKPVMKGIRQGNNIEFLLDT